MCSCQFTVYMDFTPDDWDRATFIEGYEGFANCLDILWTTCNRFPFYYADYAFTRFITFSYANMRQNYHHNSDSIGELKKLNICTAMNLHPFCFGFYRYAVFFVPIVKLSFVYYFGGWICEPEDVGSYASSEHRVWCRLYPCSGVNLLCTVQGYVLVWHKQTGKTIGAITVKA